MVTKALVCISSCGKHVPKELMGQKESNKVRQSSVTGLRRPEGQSRLLLMLGF